MVKKYHIVILLLIFLFHITNNFIILKQDNTLPFGHEGLYYRHSIELYQQLFENPRLIFKKILHINAVYPPLLYLSPLPFYCLFNQNYDTASFTVSLIYLGIFLVSLYLVGSKLFNPEVGLLSAIICSFFMGIFGYSRMFLMAFPSVALFVLNIYFMIKSDSFKKISFSLLYGVILGLGMLMKKYHIVSMAGILAAYLFQQRNTICADKRRVLINLFLSSGIALIIAAPWYVLNRFAILSQLRTEKAFFNVRGISFVFLTYFKHMINYQIGIVFVVIFIVSFVYILIKRKCTLLLLSWLIWPYFIYSIVVSYKSSRYTMVILPAMAVVISAGIIDVLGRLKFKKSYIVKSSVMAGFLIYILYSFFSVSYANKGKMFTYSDEVRRHFYTGLLYPQRLNWDNGKLERLFSKEDRQQVLIDCFGCWYLVNDYIFDMIGIKRLPINFIHLEFDCSDPDYEKSIKDADFIIMRSDDGSDFPNVSEEIEGVPIERINNLISIFKKYSLKYYLTQKICVNGPMYPKSLLIYKRVQ